MSSLLDTILLTALPASGKSEVRRFLTEQDAQTVASSFHMGPTVQLDDYPYVHMMRRISQECVDLGVQPPFFASNDQPFLETRDWGTLIELLNEDYRDLHTKPHIQVASAAQWLFRRFDAARAKVGAAAILEAFERETVQSLNERLEKEARTLLQDKLAEIPETLQGKTIVIEFARGGPHGSDLPLQAPYGYQYSLSRLSDEILARASILYIWVTPEESRRKNNERARPGLEGDASILHHGVPEAVMMGDYGTDDMSWLVENSDHANCVRVEARGKHWYLPVARFDNRSDLTTFIREDRGNWAADDVEAIRKELQRVLTVLATTSRA
jgi:hypothetical protein